METSFAFEPLASSLCPGLIAVSPVFADNVDKAPMSEGGKAAFGTIGTGAACGAVAGVDSATGLKACLRRLAGFLPDCCCSHRRMVSRPISMPISRRPPASDSADSPARLKRSSSSRCGSSWAVAWLRGCRAWATAWASVVGRMGGNGWSMVSGWAVDGVQYAWRLGGARGAPRAHSKRKRLDVGVLPYCFLLLLVGEAVLIFGSFIGRLMKWVDYLDLVRGDFVELVSLSRWFPWVLDRFSSWSSHGSDSAFGGGGC